MENATDRLIAGGVSRLAPLVPPWVIGGALVPTAWATHHMWGDAGSLPWATAGLTLSGVAVTGTTALVTHARGTIGKVHSVLSAALATGWVTAATITGPFTSPVLDLGLWGGVTLAITWNLRKLVRGADGETDLARVWEEVSEKIGLAGSTLRVKRHSDRKSEATLQLVPGEQTPEDAQRARARLASGLKVAPSRVTISPDEERGDRAQLTVVHADILKADLPWHGHPTTGASIADAPLDLGLYADTDPAGYSPLNTHVQVMGMSGSAKSFGAGWNIIADAITRRDVAVLAADATKSTQTLGPLAPALHKMETTQKGAQRLLAAVHRIIAPRTAHLAERGLTEWEPDCGLSFVFVWLEEAPDMFDEADIKNLLKIGKAARSAGIHLVVSLQRATWDQIPTTLRGQLATKLCLGVESADDARHGLPTVAIEAGAEPERWANRKPGCAYLVAAGIDEARYAMPLRFWRWTVEQMKAHAAAHPAAARPLDEITINADPDYFTGQRSTPAPSGQPESSDPNEDDTTARPNFRIEDPTPDYQPNLDADIPAETNAIDFGFGGAAPVRLTSQKGRAALDHQLTEWESEGVTSFSPRDLYPLLVATGFSRSWIHKQLARLREDGRITHDPDSGSYQILPRDGADHPDRLPVPA